LQSPSEPFQPAAAGDGEGVRRGAAREDDPRVRRAEAEAERAEGDDLLRQLHARGAERVDLHGVPRRARALERDGSGAERGVELDARERASRDGELARRLQTIPGVGPSIAATLLAEIGHIERFSDFDQLLAYAGVHPAERSSGRKGASPETAWHMSKAGNAHLRAAAYRLAVIGVQHNPVIAAHYARKRAAGKSKMNALGHCMRKALSLVWGVWRNGQDFDPKWGLES